MKKSLLRMGLLGLFLVLTTMVSAASDAWISWPWDNSEATDSAALAAQDPVISPSLDGVVTDYEVTLGENLGYYSGGIRHWSADDWGDTYFTEITNITGETINGGDASTISMMFTLASGYTFTPTNVSMKAERDGTDKTPVSVFWVDGSGVKTTLVDEQVPNRVSSTSSSGDYTERDDKYSEWDVDMEDATACKDSCGLQIVFSSLGSGKSIGFSNIVITGTLVNENAVVGDEVEISYSPANGETVASVNAIEIRTPGVQMDLVDEDMLDDFVVSNSDGSVSVGITSGYYNYEYLYDEDDVYEETTTGVKLNLASEITEDGTYSYTIPDDFFYYGISMSDISYNKEVTITFYVDSNTSGITNATLNVIGDGLYYNLNGQRVSTPGKGVYIRNGKKIILK